MAYNFDRDKYKKTFESMYGSGAYDRGLSSAREIGRSKAAADYAKQAYQEALKERQKAEKNKTYSDAVTDFSTSPDLGSGTKLDEMLKNPRKNGASRNEEEIRNDPALQEQIKEMGYSVDEFINAMYNAATDGQMRSSREYKKYADKVEKDAKNQPEPWEVQIKEAEKKASSDKQEDDGNMFSNFINKIKKSTVGRAIDSAEDFFNPFDDVSAKEAVKNFTKAPQSKAFQEVSRGANRAVDSASLGAMSNLDKRVNNREPYYNSQRDIGEGGLTDMLTSGAGYLVPGVGAYKALNVTKAGQALTRLGEKGLRQRLGSEAAKGAITGAGVAGVEVANREVLNPNDYSALDNLKHIGIGTAAGAVADPALYGLGRLAQNGLSRFAKGDVPTFSGAPSQSALDRLRPSTQNGVAQSNDLYERLMPLANQSRNVEMTPDDGFALANRQRQAEFDAAVEQQYNYLRNSMGQGVEYGTTSNGLSGNGREVTGRFSVSNNPQWYQDFYAQTGRRPNNQELRELAETHVREGFEDELGSLPAWESQTNPAVKEIDDQIDDLIRVIDEDPSQEPVLRPILEALEQDRADVLNKADAPVSNRLRAGVDYEPIEARPTTLDDIVRQNGFEAVTPESVASAYNNKTWYHGTGTQGLTPDDLDPFVGNHEGLFGNGIYLTDEPNIAQGYAQSRSKRTGTPGIYEAEVKVDKVLDLETPPTPEALDAILKSVKDLDSYYQSETGTPQYFTKLMSEQAQQGKTTEEMIQSLRSEIREFSNGAGISTSEFVEDFNNLAVNLKNAGFDGITHTGGARTGNDPHRVLIMLDPNDAYSGTGRAGQISRFEAMAQPEVAATNEPSLARLKKGVDYEPIEQPILGGKLARLKDGEMPRGEALPPAKVDNPKELVKKQISMEGQKDKKKWSFDKFYTAWIDDLRPLNKASKELGGDTLSFENNPYTQARLARGVAGKAETYLKGGIYDESGQKVGKALEEILKPIESKFDDFLAYATSKRALDYDDKGLTAGIKPKDVENLTDRQLADATIKQLEAESPEFKAAHQELIQYSNRLMDELVDAGVLDEGTVLSLREENPNYIPMFRVQDPKVRGFQPLSNPKHRYANLGEAFKKRTGSEKEIINPVESIIKNTYLTLNMAERNRVGRSLLELVDQAGDNTWGRALKADKGLSVDQVTSVLDDAGKQITEGDAPALDNLFKGEGNKVYVYRDGQRVEVELQEDLYKAMLSLDTQKQNFFIQMLSVPTRMLRTGAVLSPDFGPVNIFRDQFSAFVNSKYGFVPFVDMFKGLGNVLKKDSTYWQWKDNGGANSVLSSLDREYLQQDLRKMVKQTFKENVKDKAKHPLRTALEPLRKASEITEEATRLGEFKKGLKKGATPREAAFASRDLIDFNRAGNLGRQYNQITAFFNAAVQSTDKLARTFKENPKQASINAALGITMPSLALYFMNQDKEWYKEIPQRDRDLYWHFEVGDQIYKLPKPFEAGIIFGTTMERLADFLKTQDPESFEGLGKSVREAFTPSWIPTALSPWIEVYANRSFYFDSPIVPRREQSLLPEDQYGPYQSEISKGLGALMNKSPRNIEHVFRGYTGGLGRYGLQLADEGYQATTGKNQPELPDKGLADTPIISRFVVKNLEGTNQSVNDFYERMDKLRRENLSAKKNETASPSADAYKAMNQLSSQISELQAEKRKIIEDRNLSGEEKAEIIKIIDQNITQIAKYANTIK